METNESLIVAAFYAVVGILIYNTFRHSLKLNLPCSLILTIGLFYSIFSLMQKVNLAAWLSEYSWAIFCLGATTAIIAIAESLKKGLRQQEIKNIKAGKEDSHV